MADMKQIHDFAVKWCDKFRDQNINYIELVDHYMADDCAALGFEMDCGHAFSEKYGNAANNHEALDRIIDDVTDIPLLGSAIYSQWRYFNHWAYTGAEILEPENRAWFILALSRLALLSGENPFIFQGTLMLAIEKFITNGDTAMVRRLKKQLSKELSDPNGEFAKALGNQLVHELQQQIDEQTKKVEIQIQ